MQFTMTAVSGPILDVMPYPRKCVRSGAYGVVKEALRAFKRYKTCGQLRIVSADGKRYMRINYAGSGDAEVAYYDRARGCYWVTRRDTCEIETQSIRHTQVWPAPADCDAMRPALKDSFVGVRA